MADFDEESEDSSGGLGKKIMMILLLLILIAIGVFFFFNTSEEEEKEKVAKIREGPPPLVNPQYLPLGTFVVNLQGGKYYLKTTIQLAFENASALSWLTPRLPIIRDVIITHLQSLTPKELNNPVTIKILRSDLLTKINSYFPNKSPWEDQRPVKKILFEEFYFQ